jgi:hypothetical protein
MEYNGWQSYPATSWNKVTGTYKGIGTIDAVYSKQTRKLKGNSKILQHSKPDFLNLFLMEILLQENGVGLRQWQMVNGTELNM